MEWDSISVSVITSEMIMPGQGRMQKFMNSMEQEKRNVDQDNLYGRILERMRHLCSVREYCTSDICRKITGMLVQAGYGKEPGAGPDGAGRQTVSAADIRMASADDIESRVIASLIEDGYLSDRRYAAAFARDKASISGWGSVKIRYALSAKGIDKDIIAAALEEIDESRASDRLEKLLETKFIRDRLVRFAVGRGYSYGEVLPVADRIIGRVAEDGTEMF